MLTQVRQHLQGSLLHGDRISGLLQKRSRSLIPAFGSPAARRGTAAHYICNHLIEVEGDNAQGEASALAWHLVEAKAGQGYVEDFVGVRYLDIYRKENGLWRFAKRQTTIDFRVERTQSGAARKLANPLEDLSYKALTSKLFALGGLR